MSEADVSSFLEVPEGTTVKVRLDGVAYDLGYVERLHATSHTYVVWEDQEQRIWYESSDRETINLEDFHRFWNRYQLVSCRTMQNLNDDTRHAYIRMLSSAVASALERQFAAADESLDQAVGFIETANERVSRRRYTLGSVIAVILCLVVSSVVYALRLEADSLVTLAGAAMLGGSLGALLSALAGKTQGLDFDPDASVIEGLLNGSLRVIYGVASAFVVVLALKSGAISTPLITAENEKFSLIVIATAGGFAERWAADMIKRFSSSTESQG